MKRPVPGATCVAASSDRDNYEVGGVVPFYWRERPHLASPEVRASAALGVLERALELIRERGWTPVYGGTGRITLTAALQQTGEIEDEWARCVVREFITGVSIHGWESRPEREPRDVLRVLDRAIAACGGVAPQRRGGWFVDAPAARRLSNGGRK